MTGLSHTQEDGILQECNSLEVNLENEEWEVGHFLDRAPQNFLSPFTAPETTSKDPATLWIGNMQF